MAEITTILPLSCFLSTNDQTKVGDKTAYPLGLTLEELVFLFYKNKSYSVYASDTRIVDISRYAVCNNEQGNICTPQVFNCTQSGVYIFCSAINDPNPRDCHQDGTSTFNQEVPVSQQSESDLICNLGFSFSDPTNQGGYPTGQASGFSINIQPQGYKYQELYYPFIVVGTASHTSQVDPNLIGHETDSINAWYNTYIGNGFSNSYNDDGSTCSLDIFGTTPKTVNLYLTGIYFENNGQPEGDNQQGWMLWYPGGVYYLQCNIAYRAWYYNGQPPNDVGFDIFGTEFSASASSAIEVSTASTWDYNP